MAKAGNLEAFIAMYEEEIMKDHHGRAIRIKNVGQKYIDAVKTHDVIFGWDLRGQEKPLAVVMAVAALKKAKYKNYFNSSSGGSWRKLGLLPGDLKEKSILIYVQFTMPCIKFWYGSYKSFNGTRRY